MKRVDSSVYSKEYYLNTCLGFEKFEKFNGNKLNSRWEKLLSLIKVGKDSKILDVGCGRGDLVLYCAKKGAFVVGIDYSKDAIDIARNLFKKQNKNIQKKIKFYNMDAKNIDFKKNSFDTVVSFDVFEHLYKEELEIVMKKISKVLNRNGTLLIHTEANKIYLNFTHKFYIYPVSSVLIYLNKLFFKKEYAGFSKDPRNELHKIQHVNEPTLFYLKNLFKRHNFEGKIISNVSLIKENLSWKDRIYNHLVILYPFCNLPIFNLFFAYDYICIMKNKK